MLVKRYSVIIYLIITFYFAGIGCTHHGISDGLHLSVKEVKIDSWLNLMPGGPGSFHFAGEIKLKNEESYDLENVSLSLLTVVQNNKELYSFTPDFFPKVAISHPTDTVPITIPWLEPETDIIPSRTEKYYLFYTKKGLIINKELDVDLPIKLIMLFRENDDSFLYEIENIKVEKVY